jgi:outer membrane immunogenic protein
MRHAKWTLGLAGLAGALLLAPSLAKATDLLPPRQVQPVIPAEPLTWQGFYIGGNLGAAFDPNNLSITDLSPAQDLKLNFSSDTAFMGGVQGGYNWQANNLLLGIEGDVDFANNIDYLASIRGRLGWATPNWLFYGTAGAAFIDTNTSFMVASAANGPANFKFGTTDTGFVGGGGIDYKISPKISVGVEGLYYNFGSDKQNFVAGANEPFVLKDDLDFAVVRARLNFHFN